jgi:iron uptake system component EfeO
VPPFARAALAAPLLVTSLLLAACGGDGGDGGGSDAIAVTSTDTACELAATSAPAGSVTFAVTNDGGEATEFYVYEEDGSTIVGEVEGIGPGLTRDLSVTLEQGSYVTACKPGERGEGIRAPFQVTG